MDDFTAELRQGLDTTPDGTLARWMSRIDGCPLCPNSEAPHRVEVIERDKPDDCPGFRAYYRCTDCRHSWWTSWSDINWEGLFA